LGQARQLHKRELLVWLEPLLPEVKRRVAAGDKIVELR
jgi:hypothetical protein